MYDVTMLSRLPSASDARMEGLGQGAKIGEMWRERQQRQALNQIYAAPEADQMAIAQQSGMAGLIVPALIKQRADAEKARVDLDKDRAVMQKTKLDANISAMDATNNAIASLRPYGDKVTKADLIPRLSGLVKMGALDDEQAKGIFENAPEDGTDLQNYIASFATSRDQLTLAGQEAQATTAANAQANQATIAEQTRQSQEQRDADQRAFQARQNQLNRDAADKRQQAALAVTTARQAVADANALAKSQKLSPSALTALNDSTEMITKFARSSGKISEAIALLDTGTVGLGPVDRAVGWVRNKTGNSNEESRAQERLMALVNEAWALALQANKGTQTERDAIQALQTIIATGKVTDAGVLKQALVSLSRTASDNIKVEQANMNRVLVNSGRAPMGQASAPKTDRLAGQTYSKAQIESRAKMRGVSVEALTKAVLEAGGVVK